MSRNAFSAFIGCGAAHVSLFHALMHPGFCHIQDNNEIRAVYKEGSLIPKA